VLIVPVVQAFGSDLVLLDLSVLVFV